MLSAQSLLSTVVAAIAQPRLGLTSDHAGLGAAYFALAAAIGLGALLLFRPRRIMQFNPKEYE